MLQAQERAAWLQDMFMSMEEGEDEEGIMAGLFGKVGRSPAEAS